MFEYLKKNKLLLLVSLILSCIVSFGVVYLSIILEDIVNIATEGSMDGFYRSMTNSIIYLIALALFKYIYGICNKILVKRITQSLRDDIFRKTFQKDYSEYERSDNAEYISLLTNDIKIIEENFIVPLFRVMENVILFCLAVYMIVSISSAVLLALVICMVVMMLISVLFSSFLQKRQEGYSETLGKYTAKIKDLLGGFTVIKSFNETKNANKEFKSENKKLSKVKFGLDALLAVNQSTSDMLGLLTMFVVIAIGSFKVLSGEVLVGTLVALVQLCNSFVTPIMEITMSIPQMQSIKPIMAKFKSLDVKEDSNIITLNNDISKFESGIEMKDLCFKYQEDKEVIHNVNLKIEKNKKYLLLGKSGSGKTTLLKLILGQSSNYTGQIRWDNTEIRDGNVSNLYGYIQQNVYIFNKTIRDNIALYKDFSDIEINKALKESGLNEIDLNESGLNLSGGQKQRVSIARALIRKKPLLVIDEGTSAVDLKTSNEIESKLLTNKDLTMIVISHKINKEILKLYDEIIYMDEGRILEQGNYEDLLKRQGALYNILLEGQED